jgi:hypothetical protein
MTIRRENPSVDKLSLNLSLIGRDVSLLGKKGPAGENLRSGFLNRRQAGTPVPPGMINRLTVWVRWKEAESRWRSSQ